MLYTGREETSKPHDPRINNNLEEVKCGLGAKIGFWILVILTIGLFYIFKIKRINELNRLQMDINESASNIDIQLQKRHDTLTKLVDIVKSQASFDQETLTNITALRSGFNNADKNQKEDILNRVTTGLNMAFENYPQIAADRSASQLMMESSMLEKEIAASRRLYNANVTKFNSIIYTFPTKVFLSGKNYYGIPLFAASETSKQDVEVKF